MKLPATTFGRILAVLAAILAAGITIDVVDNGPDREPGKPRTETHVRIGATTKVDNADADSKPNDVVALSPTARDVARDFVEDPGDLAADKPGAAPLEGAAPQIDPNVIPAPLGADEIEGCRTRFLDVNFSQRSYGQDAVIWFTLHFTGGRDIPNSRADVDGLTAYGNQPSSRVSWHFNLDKDGNCDYNVPLRLKSWTFGNANSRSINVEVHGSGEPPYLRPAGYRKLARIVRQVRRSYPRIRLALGSLSDCGPGSPGIVTHWMGGPCSGGHTDIRPRPVEAVVARLQQLSGPPPAVVADCRHIARWRSRYPRGRGSSSASRSHIRGHLASARKRSWDCPRGSSRPARAR